MGKASRIKRRALKSQRRVRRGGGSYGYYGALAAVCVVGTSLVFVSKAGTSDADVAPKANKDHWHAAIGANICGTWLPAIPEFEKRADNASLTAGIHSHGDGLMHIHPFSGDEAGKNATVGNFLEFAGYDVGTDFIEAWDGSGKRTDGDKCGEGDDAEKAEVRWTVNGEEQKGNPGSFRPRDQDVIGIYFTSSDTKLEDLGPVPSEANLANPVDVEPTDTTVAGDTSATTVAGDTSATTVGSTAASTTTAATAAE
jgi:hypothetical protein